MPNPRRTKSGSWEYRFTHHGRAHQLTRPTKTAALRDGEHLRRQIVDGYQPDNRTLADQLDAWLTSRTDLAAGSILNYRQAIRALAGHPAMQLRLVDIRPDHVRDLIGHLHNQVSASTVKVYSSPLQQALGQAVDDGLIVRNPWRGIVLPREPNSNGSPGRILTPAEFHRLVDSTPACWRLDLELLVSTGIRWGEFSALVAADVNVAARTLSVSKSRTRTEGVGPTKTGGARVVPLSATMVDRLAALPPDGPALFVNTQGRPWRHQRWYATVWQPAVAAAGLSGLRVHDLRHTAASWLLNRVGVDVVTVQQILGHSRLETTSRYLHTTSGHLLAAADGLSGLAGGIRVVA